MICKRCEQRIPDNTRNRAPYCRHCYSAIQHKKALDKINNLWDKVTNNG
jgi:RNA polymerase-binding transcription factor DksA